MRHPKIKGINKRNKRRNVWHFSLFFSTVYDRSSAAVCGEKGKCNVTPFREETTCEKCKKTPQFLIKNYERRFLGKH